MSVDTNYFTVNPIYGPRHHPTIREQFVGFRSAILFAIRLFEAGIAWALVLGLPPRNDLAEEVSGSFGLYWGALPLGLSAVSYALMRVLCVTQVEL